MKKAKAKVLAELNEIAKPSDAWLAEAQFRVANQHGLKHSQATALKILRTLRKQGKTQKQLAAALQVSPQQVNKWVKGKENFTFETIAKIEAALDIRLIEIPWE